jgi:dihydroorotate dehydrogenase (NAD+) catalytic subunit
LITKAVSIKPRRGNPPPRVAEFGSGMLNSVGLANPGVEHVARVEIPWLAEHLGPARLVVNVVGFELEEYAHVIQRLDDHSVIAAYELNVSCPNTERGGEEFGANDEVLFEVVTRCRARTDKPILVKLAPTLPDIGATASVAARAGASGVSVVNTLPGLLFDLDGGRQTGGPRLGAGQGGVSGPCLLPVGLLAVRRVLQATGLPVIGIGGIRRPADVRQYLAVGASLVAVGTAALADPRCPERLVAAWRTGRDPARSEPAVVGY